MTSIINSNQEELEKTNEMTTELRFVDDTQEESIIKVIGVGGGGSNAVNHMYKAGIKGVDFYVCNTDKQALNTSPIKNKIRLGEQGAGGKPEVARKAAIEHSDSITEVFSENTRMVFLTACLGGGTGTGASPVIAETIKKIKINDPDIENILVIAVMTLPFSFEGKRKRQIAMDCIHEVNKIADSVIVINNDKLRTLGNLALPKAFALADDILLTATKSIAELITCNLYVNIDFRDVHSVMQKSGTALMGSAMCDGEDRATKAIEAAASSVLLDDQDIRGAKGCLVSITYSEDSPITMDEFDTLTEFVQNNIANEDECNLIWGTGFDNSLEGNLKVSLIVTGFKSVYDQYCSPEVKKASGIENQEIHVPLNEEPKAAPTPKPTENIFAPKDKTNDPRLQFETRIEEPVQAANTSTIAQNAFAYQNGNEQHSQYTTFETTTNNHATQNIDYPQPTQQNSPTANNISAEEWQTPANSFQQPVQQPIGYQQPVQQPVGYQQPAQQPFGYQQNQQSATNSPAYTQTAAQQSQPHTEAPIVTETIANRQAEQTITTTLESPSPINYNNFTISENTKTEPTTIEGTNIVIDIDGNQINATKTEVSKEDSTKIYHLDDSATTATPEQAKRINPEPIQVIPHTHGYQGIDSGNMAEINEMEQQKNHTMWQGRIKTLIDTLRTDPNGVQNVTNMTIEQMRKCELYSTTHSSESEMSDNIVDSNGRLTENHKVYCNID